MHTRPILHVFSIILFSICALQTKGEDGTTATDTVSVDFTDMSRATILNNFAKIFDIEISLPDDYKDSAVSIKLRDVTWQQLFSVTLQDTPYSYIERSSKAIVFRKDKPEIKFAVVGKWKFSLGYMLKIRGQRSYHEDGRYDETTHFLDSDGTILKSITLQGTWQIRESDIEVKVELTSDSIAVPAGTTLRQTIHRIWPEALTTTIDENQIITLEACKTYQSPKP